MTRYIKYPTAILATALLIAGCGKDDYTLGALTAPTEVNLATTNQGTDGSNPDGDGSGIVNVAASAKGALAYKIDWDASDGISFDALPSPNATHTYTTDGTHTYTITLAAFGPGATPTTITKDVTVKFVFVPDADLVSNLVGTGSKTWRVDSAAPAHFGVGPYNTGSVTPEWYAAAPNEKATCCLCFYTAKYTFSTVAGAYSLAVATPNGAFTKTGANAGGLPGIPSSGDEGCYTYAGGTSSFAFVPSGSGIAASASTKTAILLGGNNTFIGYGAQKKEYEILSIDETHLALRVQGTESGNAWYLKLVAL